MTIQAKTIIKSSSMIAGAISLTLLAGCAASFNNLTKGYNTNISGTTYPPTDPNQVKLVYLNQPDKESVCNDNYTTIGQISSMTYSEFGWSYSQQTIADNLRKGGASVGANAVINISDGSGLGGISTGYAVHCN